MPASSHSPRHASPRHGSPSTRVSKPSKPPPSTRERAVPKAAQLECSGSGSGSGSSSSGSSPTSGSVGTTPPPPPPPAAQQVYLPLSPKCAPSPARKALPAPPPSAPPQTGAPANSSSAAASEAAKNEAEAGRTRGRLQAVMAVGQLSPSDMGTHVPTLVAALADVDSNVRLAANAPCLACHLLTTTPCLSGAPRGDARARPARARDADGARRGGGQQPVGRRPRRANGRAPCTRPPRRVATREACQRHRRSPRGPRLRRARISSDGSLIATDERRLPPEMLHCAWRPALHASAHHSAVSLRCAWRPSKRSAISSLGSSSSWCRA